LEEYAATESFLTLARDGSGTTTGASSRVGVSGRVGSAAGRDFKGLRTGFVATLEAGDSGASVSDDLSVAGAFVSPVIAWEIRSNISEFRQTRTMIPIKQATLRAKKKGLAPWFRLR